MGQHTEALHATSAGLVLMLYIIGVAHRAQARRPEGQLTGAQQAFGRCLCRITDEVRPGFIAEEDSQEALAERQGVSIAKEIAEKMGVEHRYCDPTRGERRAIGYKDGQTLELELFMHGDMGLSSDEIRNRARAIEIARYFPIRERFWLERLSDCLDRDGVFICGDGHIQSFGRLLESNGIPYTVVERGIGWNKEDEWFHAAQHYLDQHPELKDG
jgi:hypothetical protein